MWAKGNVNNPPFLLKALAEKSRNDELALPQTNQSTAIVIPNVPSTLDDSLVRYARTHKFSEPRRDAGLGYLEYRNQLVQERETKLRTLRNKKALPTLAIEIKPPSTKPAHSTTPANNEMSHIDRFNQMLVVVGETGKTIQRVAFETSQRYVLKALGVPVEEEDIEAKKENVDVASDAVTRMLAALGDDFGFRAS